MLVLVDGYNVTMRDPAMDGRSKEAQREALCARLTAIAPAIAPGGRIAVVFDAHDTLVATAQDLRGLKVIYAASADDEIVRCCASAKGQVVVYTDDLRLRARIAQDVGRHVESRDAEALFIGARAQPKRRRPGVTGDDDLPPKAKDITAELSDYWLGDEDE